MQRRRLFTLVWVMATSGWLAQAQPAARPNLFITIVASTPQDRTPYTVSVDVTVENKGQTEAPKGILELVLKPARYGANKPKTNAPTMWDPYIQAQEVEELKPGARKVLHFSTIYAASSSFRGRTSSFKCNNIDPTGGDVTVSMSAAMK